MMRFNAKNGYVASRWFVRVFVLFMTVAFSLWARGQVNPIRELFSERPIPGGSGKAKERANYNAAWRCHCTYLDEYGPDYLQIDHKHPAYR
jgi:hypothetical protein